MIGLKRLFRLAIILTLAIGMAGCRDSFFTQDPPSGPRELFATFWNDVRITYPFFAYDGVDWDASYARYAPRIRDNSPEDTLFAVMSQMMEPLLDGHASLRTPGGKLWVNKSRRRYSPEFRLSTVVAQYLGQDTAGFRRRQLIFGQPTPGVLYVWIRTFAQGRIAEQVDSVLRLGSYSKLILDVRSNGGGLIVEADRLAGLLTAVPRDFGYEQYKNGALADDFTAAQLRSYQPVGRTFAGPVRLLTNRYSASASERLRLEVKVRPEALTLGDTTFGATSPIIDRRLPNGWEYVLVGSINTDLAGNLYERTGIPPDRRIANTAVDLAQGRDRVLEAALAE